MSKEFERSPARNELSGARRAVNTRSGFKSSTNATGGEYKRVSYDTYSVTDSRALRLAFSFDANAETFTGFGLWFRCDQDLKISVTGLDTVKTTKSQNAPPNWSKIGSIWQNEEDTSFHIEVAFTFDAAGTRRIDIYQPQCGLIEHEYLDNEDVARPNVIKNLYQFAPEGLLVSSAGVTRVSGMRFPLELTELVVKSCNRCGRYLPVNTDDERLHLSFTNHCTSKKCVHANFYNLKNPDDGGSISVDSGFQLECRYCKKFAVNAALNPTRTASQMKEDAARRRAFEDLIGELLGYSPQLEFRHKNGGKELTKSVWEKFGKKCFKCKSELKRDREMALDHTLPLAMLWPLDGTATCLCIECNSNKSDKSPSAFYTQKELTELSKLTGIAIVDLQTLKPNMAVVDLLIERLPWLYGDYLKRPEINKIRDGKDGRVLLLRSLQRVLNAAGRQDIDLVSKLSEI